MVLIKCPECGKEISDNASSFPKRDAIELVIKERK